MHFVLRTFMEIGELIGSFQKCHRLDASCGFYPLDASLSSNHIKLVVFIKSVKIRLDATLYFQTCCKLLKQFMEQTAAHISHLK